MNISVFDKYQHGFPFSILYQKYRSREPDEAYIETESYAVLVMVIITLKESDNPVIVSDTDYIYQITVTSIQVFALNLRFSGPKVAHSGSIKSSCSYF